MNMFHISAAQKKQLWQRYVAHELIGLDEDLPISVSFCDMMTQRYDDAVERLEAAEAQVSALNNQLTAARRVKQSLLQNLLTGRIRLTP